MSDTNQYTYPVGLTPEDRAQVEDLHAATLGIPRGTLLRALIRMSLPAALERPEVLGPHLVRNKGTPRVSIPANPISRSGHSIKNRSEATAGLGCLVD